MNNIEICQLSKLRIRENVIRINKDMDTGRRWYNVLAQENYSATQLRDFAEYLILICDWEAAKTDRDKENISRRARELFDCRNVINTYGGAGRHYHG